MIDQNLRKKYFEDSKTKTLVNGMKDSILAALQNNSKSGENEEVLKLVVKREEEKELIDKMGKIGQAIAMIYKVVSKPIVLPKIFQVEGRVEVSRQAPVEVKNLNELKKYFESLEKTFNNLLIAVQSMPRPEIKLPKIEVPAQMNENPELIALIEKLNDKIDNLQPQEVKFPKTIDVGNFPITMTPQPVTNININALQGLVKTTSTTVGTSLVTLPGYGQLFNRRALQIYNNSANTIYYGGSDVSTSNGIPVAASSFSNVIDAGYNMIVYGIASTTGNDIRVIEVATRNEPNISPQS